MMTVDDMELVRQYGKYDFIANLPNGSAKALQRAAKEKFGLIGNREIREMDVLLLTVKRPNTEGLRPSETSGGSSQSDLGRFSCVNQPLSCLTSFLQNRLKIPVVDNTGLAESFDIDLVFNESEDLKQVLLDELGLQLTPAKEPIEMLIVQKAR